MQPLMLPTTTTTLRLFALLSLLITLASRYVDDWEEESSSMEDQMSCEDRAFLQVTSRWLPPQPVEVASTVPPTTPGSAPAAKQARDAPGISNSTDKPALLGSNSSRGDGEPGNASDFAAFHGAKPNISGNGINEDSTIHEAYVDSLHLPHSKVVLRDRPQEKGWTVADKAEAAGGNPPARYLEREELQPLENFRRLLQSLRRGFMSICTWLTEALYGSRPMVSDREETAQLIAFIIFTLIVQAVLGCLVAHTYMDTYRVQPEVDMEKRGSDLSQWSSWLLCDLSTEPRILLASCFCPCLRWADNMHTMGIMSFWAAFWLSTACVFLTELTYGFFWLFVVLGLTSFRQRLRKQFRMERHGTCCVQAADFFRYLCCLPCTLAQDARQVEDACRADHPAVLVGTALQVES